jgi:hypothetical protein
MVFEYEPVAAIPPSTRAASAMIEAEEAIFGG